MKPNAVMHCIQEICKSILNHNLYATKRQMDITPSYRDSEQSNYTSKECQYTTDTKCPCNHYPFSVPRFIHFFKFLEIFQITIIGKDHFIGRNVEQPNRRY